MRDLKGIRYLARMLAEPQREIHVLDLVGGAATGSAGPLLDTRAKAAYRRRLAEIDDDLAEAERLNDPGRAAGARREREILIDELSRAFGAGDRERLAGDSAERARVSVTRAVRQAIARVAKHHPSLGEHLTRAIKTGTYCAYAPDPRAGIVWGPA